MGEENCSSALQLAEELGKPFPGGFILTLARSARKRCSVGVSFSLNKIYPLHKAWNYSRANVRLGSCNCSLKAAHVLE